MSSPTPKSFIELLHVLPPELLSLIMLHAVQRDRLTFVPEAVWRRTLCMVCKRWSKALYDTPAAWTKLAIAYGSKTPVPTVLALLANSKSALKDVEVSIHKDRRVHATHTSSEANEMKAFIHKCFMILDTHFPHIAVFKIICPEFSASELALAYLAHMDCRRMTHIHIILRLASDSYTIRERPSLTSTLPMLSMLYTAKCLPPSNMFFTGGTVTDLRLVFFMDQELIWGDLRAILANFPRLLSLKLSGIICCEFMSNRHSLTIPDLTTLHFVLKTSQMSGVIYNVITPSLKVLRLTLTVRHGNGVQWLTKNCAQLGQAVDVDLLITRSFSADLLSDVLRAFSSAVSIDVSRCSLNVHKSLLAILAGPELRLPHLKVLTVGWTAVVIGFAGISAVSGDCRVILNRCAAFNEMLRHISLTPSFKI
ncbi:hypothetical protein C8R47DRAFT_1206989 [Mycena vitilis]|nr:hypothetical protein C8R47DRAFT_1206989 [Mycena vitilis]